MDRNGGTGTRGGTVGDLSVGDVFTAPGRFDWPVWVTSVTNLGDAPVRSVTVANLQTGERDETQYMLQCDLEVVVYDVTVMHHFYKNVSGQTQLVELGHRRESIPPGDTFHYTAEAKPDVFPESKWFHSTEPVEIRRTGNNPHR